MQAIRANIAALASAPAPPPAEPPASPHIIPHKPASTPLGPNATPLARFTAAKNSVPYLIEVSEKREDG
jgi:hypothetical protein